MTFQQDDRLIEILRGMQTCERLLHFASDDELDICSGAIFDPNQGYVPRAFGGAKAKLSDVAVVIVSNGPQAPIVSERYSDDVNKNLHSILGNEYFHSRPWQFHENLFRFLDMVFLDLDGELEEQLKRSWVTNSLHCTFEQKNVSAHYRKICASKHLIPALKLFTDPIVVLAGGVVKSLRELIKSKCPEAKVCLCDSFSPLNLKQERKARETSKIAAKQCREHIAWRSMS